MKKTIAILLLFLPSILFAGVQEGIRALQSGNYKTAYEEFKPLAEKGDDRAAITIGNFFLKGQGFKINHDTALKWYLIAFEKHNGDAYSNIGVMFRDGLGVNKNQKMAYALFLITHVRGLGSQSTQQRANSCLRRIISKLKHEEFVEVFNYTEEYIIAYVKSKGTLKGYPKKFKPSSKFKSLKQKDWWTPGELDFLDKKPITK
jgi:hypothetical protein